MLDEFLFLKSNLNLKALSFQIYRRLMNKIYDSNQVKINSAKNCFSFELNETVMISGDIKVTFINSKKVVKNFFFTVL